MRFRTAVADCMTLDDQNANEVLHESFEPHSAPGSRRQPLPGRKLLGRLPSARYEAVLSYADLLIYDNEPGRPAESEDERAVLAKLRAADSATRDAIDN